MAVGEVNQPAIALDKCCGKWGRKATASVYVLIRSWLSVVLVEQVFHQCAWPLCCCKSIVKWSEGGVRLEKIEPQRFKSVVVPIWVWHFACSDNVHLTVVATFCMWHIVLYVVSCVFVALCCEAYLHVMCRVMDAVACMRHAACFDLCVLLQHAFYSMHVVCYNSCLLECAVTCGMLQHAFVCCGACLHMMWCGQKLACGKTMLYYTCAVCVDIS